MSLLDVARPISALDGESRLIQSTRLRRSRLGKGAIDHIAYSVLERKDLDLILDRQNTGRSPLKKSSTAVISKVFTYGNQTDYASK